MKTNDNAKRLMFAGEVQDAINILANIVQDWNDDQEEPDERGRGNGAIGLIVFDDGSGMIAQFEQGPDNDPLGNSFIVYKFSNPRETQSWLMENISERTLYG